jgi:hypothetical protein
MKIEPFSACRGSTPEDKIIIWRTRRFSWSGPNIQAATKKVGDLSVRVWVRIRDRVKKASIFL